jgi:hypothetical protein
MPDDERNTMSETLETIEKRTTTRDFKEDQVPREIV